MGLCALFLLISIDFFVCVQYKRNGHTYIYSEQAYSLPKISTALYLT